VYTKAMSRNDEAKVGAAIRVHVHVVQGWTKQNGCDLLSASQSSGLLSLVMEGGPGRVAVTNSGKLKHWSWSGSLAAMCASLRCAMG